MDNYCARRINEKCQWVPSLLHPIKKAIIGSKFEFRGTIDSGLAYYFNDHQTLLNHIGNELLPTSASCHSYNFKIYLYSDHSSTVNIIGKILQYDPISDCSQVLFDLRLGANSPVELLPINVISNWLIRSHNYDAINANVKKQEELFLEIRIYYRLPSDSFSAMLNCLKKVNN